MKVLLDANILYPPTLRDLLLLLSKEGVFEPYWSKTILDEWQYNVMKSLKHSQQQKVKQLCAEMIEDFPNGMVTHYESIMPTVRSRDEDDKHVAAAAIGGKVDFLLTFNVRDFPKSSFRPYGITPIHPDRWLCEIWTAQEARMHHCMHVMTSIPRYQEASIASIIEALHERGLVKSMRMARKRFLEIK